MKQRYQLLPTTLQRDLQDLVEVYLLANLQHFSKYKHMFTVVTETDGQQVSDQ